MVLQFKSQAFDFSKCKRLGVKCYAKKKELIEDWKYYLEILASYLQRNIARLCEATANMDVDYIVFPRAEVVTDSCYKISATFTMVLSGKN